MARLLHVCSQQYLWPDYYTAVASRTCPSKSDCTHRCICLLLSGDPMASSDQRVNSVTDMIGLFTLVVLFSFRFICSFSAWHNESVLSVTRRQTREISVCITTCVAAAAATTQYCYYLLLTTTTAAAAIITPLYQKSSERSVRWMGFYHSSWIVATHFRRI